VSRALHKTIKKVTGDLDEMRFNTAIAAMMELVNVITPTTERPREVLEECVLLVSPFAPHLGEELWARLGHETTIAYATWPGYDETLTVDPTVRYAVQINGKLRGQLELAKGVSKEDALAAARAQENVARHLEGKTIRREIFVPGRMVNFVVS